MTITHEAYLFDPGEYAAYISETLNGPSAMASWYQNFRSQALTLFDQDPHVRKLADLYGNWDRPSIVEQFAAMLPASYEDIGFGAESVRQIVCWLAYERSNVESALALEEDPETQDNRKDAYRRGVETYTTAKAHHKGLCFIVGG